MQKYNILRQMYNYSPLNFYTFEGDETIIKSINNTLLGYKYNKHFSRDEIKLVWSEIKLHKRISIILIFLLFMYLLYAMVFPKFSILVNNSGFVNALLILLIMAIVCQVITTISTKVFEKRLKKNFGEYELAVFTPDKNTDRHYYKLFQIEVVKVLILFILVICGFIFISPFDCAKKLLAAQRYNDVVNFTTAGAKIFPIAQEWYAMRGYANYKLEKYQEAISDFDKAYELGADGFNIMNFDNKIFIKYVLKDYDSAVADFDVAISNAHNDSEKDEFLWDKAQFLYNIGKYEDALVIYDELINKAEKDKGFLLKDRLYLERSLVHKNLGNAEEEQQNLEMSGINADDILSESIPKPVLMLNEETYEQN